MHATVNQIFKDTYLKGMKCVSQLYFISRSKDKHFYARGGCKFGGRESFYLFLMEIATSVTIPDATCKLAQDSVISIRELHMSGILTLDSLCVSLWIQ